MFPKELIGILFIVLAVVLTVILVAASREKKKKLTYAETKGNKGEARISKMLEEIAKPGDKIINDVLFQLEPGNSCQIDHILINQSGIYVNETKNHAAKAYVKKGQYREYYYKSKKMFFNDPRHQNQEHITKLATKLSIPRNYLKSVVVYVNSNAKKIKVPGTYTEKTFRYAFGRKQKVLSQAEVDYFFRAISTLKLNCPITLEQHKRNYR